MLNERVGNDQWWLIISQLTFSIPPPPSEERITEDGELRVTEDGEQRVTEGA